MLYADAAYTGVILMKRGNAVYTTIMYEVKDSIATLTLNRPEVGNAFAQESYIEVRNALDAASEDPQVRVVVITGAGKHFSAGGDIRRFQRLIASGVFLQRENIMAAGRMAARIKTCNKPVIAMVNGAAAGAGCSLALACDFRVVTPKSKLVMSFIKMGLSGDTGGMYYLERLVGVARATELMMTGTAVDGTRAVELGLATRLAQEGCLAKETNRLARELAAAPTFALARQKQLIMETFYQDLAKYADREATYMADCSRTQDFAEAVTAFLEKRPPKFTGA